MSITLKEVRKDPSKVAQWNLENPLNLFKP